MTTVHDPHTVAASEARVPTVQGKKLLERLRQEFRAKARAKLPLIPLTASPAYAVVRAVDQLWNATKFVHLGFATADDALIRERALKALQALESYVSVSGYGTDEEAELVAQAEWVLRRLSKLRVTQ